MMEKSPPKPSSSSSSSVPSIPWKNRLHYFVFSVIVNACRRSDGTVNRRLFSILDSRVPANGEPRQGVRTTDVVVEPSRDIWIRVFRPSPAPPPCLPLVVFFHGGGFTLCSPASRIFDEFCRRMSREIPAVVASVNYRLAPENRCPAAYDDGLEALKFIDAGGLSEDTADLSCCFLIGDSAGGNIVHHVARAWGASRGGTRVRVAGMVAIQPLFGGEERTESEVRLVKDPMVTMDRNDWQWRAFLPEGSDRDHEAANVFGPRAAGALEEGFPPALVVVGGQDPIQDWQRRYCTALRERGKEARLVEFPGVGHGFYIYPELPESVKLMEEMRSFIKCNMFAETRGKM